MKVVILCGGQGYRLKEETEFKPKPMIYIGDHPILWHIMKIYEHFGYRDFIIALGYKGDMIKNYFLNHKYYSHDFTLTSHGTVKIHWRTQREKDKFKITFVDTGQETLTSGRVLKLKSYLKPDRQFLLTYGDGLGDVDIRSVIKYHRRLKRQHRRLLGTIIGVHPVSKWGLVEVSPTGLIKKFQEKPRLNQYVNGGFMILETSILNHMRPDEQVETTLERLTPTHPLGLYIHRGFWYAMDTYRDMEVLNQMWLNHPQWKVWS